jgi:hypothetical protein
MRLEDRPQIHIYGRELHFFHMAGGEGKCQYKDLWTLELDGFNQRFNLLNWLFRTKGAKTIGALYPDQR